MAIKYPCGICNKKIRKNSAECNICKQQIHMKCNRLSKKEYDFYKNNPKDFYCINCIAKNIPFSNLTDNELFASFKGIGFLNSTQDFSPVATKAF